MQPCEPRSPSARVTGSSHPAAGGPAQWHGYMAERSAVCRCSTGGTHRVVAKQVPHRVVCSTGGTGSAQLCARSGSLNAALAVAQQHCTAMRLPTKHLQQHSSAARTHRFWCTQCVCHLAHTQSETLLPDAACVGFMHQYFCAPVGRIAAAGSSKHSRAVSLLAGMSVRGSAAEAATTGCTDP